MTRNINQFDGGEKPMSLAMQLICIGLTLLVALTVLFWQLPAHAADARSRTAASNRVELPAEMLGTWCVEHHDNAGAIYARGDCRERDPGYDGWIEIRPDGYRGHETDCRTISSVVTRRRHVYRPVYVLQYRCRGEGTEWQERKNMFLGRGDNLMVEQK